MATPLPTPANSAEPVFQMHGVTKIYRLGDVEVHALRGVD
jgi:putative ABC transport system ATP-binding protein